jgi:leader peptidase (prepilin peptidase)/N-methyltransferase
VSTHLALFGGATIGMAMGAVMIPLTRRELAGALARADGDVVPATPKVTPWHLAALVLASGLLPGYVLSRVGWSSIAVPPLILLLGLIQLAYCDFTRRLLPKTLVYAISAAVIISGIVIAGLNNEWERLLVSALGGTTFFLLLFAMNLVNPRWMAFGDVRLSLVVGFGLAWISQWALLEGFFIANVLAAVIGLTLIAAHRADRKSALPFGLYLALGAGITILFWS